ncbi:MAG: hypothetical protein M3178_05985 [Pseudomonadota bacterium]|nr:hypothetical protein [Pseudomonadota bacterium]
MLKTLTAAILGLALVCGVAATASAKPLTTPSPPNTRYILPGTPDSYAADRLWEGRSIYRMEAPSTFYGGSDERGYPSGEPQNPRTGG